MTIEKAQTKDTKPAPKQDTDEPKIEVKTETIEEPKPAAAAKEEPKPAAKEEPKPAAKEAPKPAAKEETMSRVGRAEAIIRRNVLWSLGAGVVPIPFVDALAVSGVQIKMLAELSDLYGVPFKDDAAKKVIGSLLSSLGGVTVGAAIGSSFAKLLPGVGTALGIVTVPLVAGAFTHATGKVFLMHFESGGTILDFDPHAMRAYFKQEFERAKETVAKVQEQERANTTKAS
ncbi:YcjF family protein [Polyangium mundeleinium]|uniref:DUF697 domain-containing protein n=1 Tax=Polyangium mundeleinium TaxID=2995306 RepID=A0ABT5F0C4_9BACT|nr:DUF697 domain-containing protein [Polyangium mundeleinium]MDC0747084.1 DUF697 domain-containing protein [Polyangium mundeleinium]